MMFFLKERIAPSLNCRLIDFRLWLERVNDCLLYYNEYNITLREAYRCAMWKPDPRFELDSSMPYDTEEMAAAISRARCGQATASMNSEDDPDPRAEAPETLDQRFGE
jgi:hypothetical protein